MKLQKIPTYRTDYGVFKFEPTAGVPGFTHRVFVNGVPTSLWVARDQPVEAKRTVIFYIRAWRALEEGLPKYHYVDRDEDPPLPFVVPAMRRPRS